MSKSAFFDKIKSAVIERQVEDVYNEGISLYFPTTKIEYPFDCDGFVDTKTDNNKVLKLIIEYKLDELLANKVARAKVLLQVIFYMKHFEENGIILPNVCMVGDKNECFVMHTNELLQYLDEDIDWSIAPSNAPAKNPLLVMKIAENENINPFIFNVDENFSFKAVAEKIKDIADSIQRYVRVTEHNIAVIFDYFCRNVIKDTTKISAHDLVSIFIGIITDTENYYQHPSKANLLVTPFGNIDIKGASFKSFFAYFQREYTPQEKTKFTEIADRLIEDTERRNRGDFWTPTPFVDYAHEMITKQFGADWKEKFVVWDNSCGSKNLTRDYNFSNLYCSTLVESELEIGKRYNKEATSFQFDFLNDDLSKLPSNLLADLKANKPLLFLINPPYATAGNRDETSKKDCAKTKINEQMLKDNIGACSQNLYAQFLYRIILIKKEFNLTNVNICCFTPTLYLSGSSFAKFRSVFFDNFEYKEGMQFCASHFSNCSSNWGIGFTIWVSGKTTNKSEFELELTDYIEDSVKAVGSKVVYNLDSFISASDWAKEPIKKLPTFDEPNVSSAISIRDKENNRGKNFNGSFGFINNGGNNIDQNAQMVGLYTTAYGNGHGHGINNDNFTRCTALFSARKLIEKDWINSKDEYLKPNTDCAEWSEFENDSIIYSLFNTSSNQSSLRGVEYKGKKWDIKNEFFFMSKEDILNLANENGLDDVYSDCKACSSERYVFDLLKSKTLSNEAKAVLDKAKELVIKSFPLRKMFSEEHPEYQLDKAWDCGWYQVKAMLKAYLKEDLAEFDALYKALGNKMRPNVYKVGFLK